MKTENRMGLVAGKTCRLIVVILLVLAGQLTKVSGQTLTPLWQFGSLSNDMDGINPWAGLVQGTDGNFYGTSGGTNFTHCTVFKITPDGTLTTLWQFGSLPNDADGTSPMAGLIQGSDGNFYGTTSRGGNLLGTIFKITPSGTLTTLWNFLTFSNNFADGFEPSAALVQGGDNNFYGTTTFGGTNGYGTVFKVTSTGMLTPLWQFGSLSNNVDGRAPDAGLVQGSDGSFYGTTEGGGAHNAGTVFKITSAGTLSPLWQFGSLSNNADGLNPAAGLVQGTDGSFYGTTDEGGTNGHGTVYKITPSGTLTPLWQFGSLSNAADGGNPGTGLVLGSDGNFYGTTGRGFGSVFRITPAGVLSTLWRFGSLSNNADGTLPRAGLVQGSDGNFYGTTSLGGTNGQGTVFRLTVPINPPANQISGMQFSGADVVLNIPSVAYETYQLQFTTDPTSGIWSNVPGVLVTNCIGGLLTVTNFGGALHPQGFYRFDITP